MVSVGFQLILSILISLFCLFLSLTFYYVLRVQSNPNIAIGGIVPVVNEGLRIYYTKIFKVILIFFIILFVLLTFIPQYNIRFAFSLLLGSICSIVFSLYLLKTVYYLLLDVMNGEKKYTHRTVVFKVIVIIGFFSLSLSIICCDILFFLFGDEENIKYIIGFMLGLGVSSIAIRVNGILFKERIYYINKNIENSLLKFQERKSEYYYSAVNITYNIVDDLLNMCTTLFDSYMLILLGSILLASVIAPAELELLSNVAFDMRISLMFLPMGLSTLTILVFMFNVVLLFFLRSTKIEMLLQYFLFIIFLTLLSLSFILIFLCGFNIRVFFAYFLGLLMALAIRFLYGDGKIKKRKYDVIDIFKDIFTIFTLLSSVIMLSMYIGGSYGLSIMFLGFVSFNGIFITEVIVAAVFRYCKKITNQMTDLNGKMAFNIGNILNYNEKNPYFAKPYIIFQTVNTLLLLLVVYVIYNNIPFMNIVSFYTLGGVLLGGSILALQYLLINIIVKKDTPFFHSHSISRLQLSIAKGFNDIVDNFFLRIIDNTVKNAIIRVSIPFLSLSVIIILLLLMTDVNIVVAIIVGLILCYLTVSIMLISIDKIFNTSNISSNLIKHENFYSNFGWDVIKFLTLIILIFGFGE